MAATYRPDLDDFSQAKEKNYVLPDVSSQAEIASFNLQSVKANVDKPVPANGDRAQVLNNLEQLFAPAGWTLKPNWRSREEIIRVILEDVDPKKSPGVPWIQRSCPTNGHVLQNVSVEGLAALVEKRIEDLLNNNTTEWSDPVRLFIKREGHSRTKAMTRRWRLIWSVSLLDTIVDRLIYGPVATQFIATHSEHPAQPGRSFKHGGLHRMLKENDNGSKRYCSHDASGYDFSVPKWLTDDVSELASRLCRNPSEEWDKLRLARETAVGSGIIQFSNGTRIRQTKPCLQFSGRYTTILFNSVGVVALKCLHNLLNGLGPVQPKQAISMGDDTVFDYGKDDTPEAFVATCALLGITMTIESALGPLCLQNFCSTYFRQLACGTFVPVPLNTEKHVFNLCHVEKGKENALIEMLDSLCLEHAFSPSFQFFHNHLVRLAEEAGEGKRIRSKKFYQSITTGFESGGPAA